jgi:hypothetical protein
MIVSNTPIGDALASGARLELMSPKQRRKTAKTAVERFGKAAANPFEVKSLNAVGRSSEWQRIAALPRRTDWQDYAEALTLAFAKPPLSPGSCPKSCPCGGTGFMVLRPLQAWALSEFLSMRGGIAILGPGAGKTIISLLLPVLMGWQRPVLFVPAALRNKTLKIDYPLLSRHWRLPALSDRSGGAGGEGSLDICSYEELSRVDFADYLSKRRIPDGIVCDEVHKLARRSSGRTKRAFRYLQDYGPEFVGMTGSFVRKSVMDYGHLTLWALGDKSPVPQSIVELKTWADALDENVPEWARPEPGALMDFCREGETARDGFRRRLLETPGIISSPDLSTDCGLLVNELASPVPPLAVQEAFKGLRNRGELPGGELATTKLDQVRHAKELFLGFYYRWLWPKDSDGKPVIDRVWLDARAAWRAFVRKSVARSHGGVWYDTELQVKQGIQNGELVCLNDEYQKWFDIRENRKKLWGKPVPPKEAVWLSDYMLEAVEAWAASHKGIVWVENIAFLDRLRERRGADGKLHACFGAGENEIELEDGKRTVFASLAHGVGKNLFAWNKMLFTTPVSAPEQPIGREHRPGQKEDDVFVDVFLGCRETWWTFDQSIRDARYIQETTGQPQRMCMATITASPEESVLERCDAGQPLWAETGLARIDGTYTDYEGDAAFREETRALTRAQKKQIRADNTPILTQLKKQAKENAQR